MHFRAILFMPFSVFRELSRGLQGLESSLWRKRNHYSIFRNSQLLGQSREFKPESQAVLFSKEQKRKEG
jgi:hypothetical protein